MWKMKFFKNQLLVYTYTNIAVTSKHRPANLNFQNFFENLLWMQTYEIYIKHEPISLGSLASLTRPIFVSEKPCFQIYKIIYLFMAIHVCMRVCECSENILVIKKSSS